MYTLPPISHWLRAAPPGDQNLHTPPLPQACLGWTLGAQAKAGEGQQLDTVSAEEGQKQAVSISYCISKCSKDTSKHSVYPSDEGRMAKALTLPSFVLSDEASNTCLWSPACAKAGVEPGKRCKWAPNRNARWPRLPLGALPVNYRKICKIPFSSIIFHWSLQWQLCNRFLQNGSNCFISP